MMQTEQRTVAPSEGTGRRDQAAIGRTIVLFADGTGNAFSKQESNVWRIYDALDRSDPAQIAHYIPGVGTSGFRPWALVDGATGLGVPSNVRRLYEFLCWNVEEHDRIYLFGFSRGAFTIRTLIGMIHTEGLLSRTGQHGTASRPEMRRNVMAAWRANRSRQKRPLTKEAPTIKVARFVRDIVLRVLNVTHEGYDTVSCRARKDVKIAYLGLFDTVEAFGVPFEEMRDAIDWAIWPIRFHNRKLSDKVERARHALSLDDERQTFHPVRFDQAEEKTHRIEEVWFAGVHSDVGGGYPDDAAALVPLAWVLEGVRGELRFKRDALPSLHAAASSFGPIHDSRSGIGNFYRYFPRIIGMTDKDGGPPIVHYSVVERMVYGGDRYAPHALPAHLQVLMPDGCRCMIEGLQPTDALKKPGRTGSSLRTDATAENALIELGQPLQFFVDSVHDGAWLRRKVYFALLAACLLFASLPITASLFGIRLQSSSGEILVPGQRISQTNSVLVAWVQDIAATVSGFVPGYLQPWLQAIVAQPSVAFGVTLLITVLYRINARLRDRIADDARCAWFGSGRDETTQPLRGLPLSLAGFLMNRRKKSHGRGFFYWFWFTFVLVALAVTGFLYADRVALSYRVGAGSLCKLDTDVLPQPVGFASTTAKNLFEPNKPCWDTGFYLEKGRAYSLDIEMTAQFQDRSTVADLSGFEEPSLLRFLATPLKRRFSAAYFQPIARIGSQGMTEMVLTPLNGEQPRMLGDDAKVKTPAGASGSTCKPVEAPEGEVKDIAARLGLQSRFTSHFVAPETGELFLYVNDAMLGGGLFSALLGLHDRNCFYENNSGSAHVSVVRLPTGEK